MRGAERWTFLALALGILAIAGLPLALLARVAVTGPEGLMAIPEALESGAVRRAIWRSLESAAISAVAATALGLIIALVLGLTDVRLKGPAMFALLIPMMIPPHVTAIAWIQTLGPSSPLLGALGLAPPPGSDHPLYSAGGVWLLLTIQHTPLTVLILRAALRALPAEMLDAARVAGAGPLGGLRRVVLPLLAPSLIAALSLAFVAALGNFGIPALLGIPARYTTLPVLIWQRLAGFGTSMLTDMAVLAALMAGIAIAAVALQLWLQRRARVALIGPPGQPLAIRLGRARPLVEGALALFLLLVLVLPLAALFATALVPTYGVDLSMATLTFDNFAEVLLRQSVTLRAFANSTLIAGAAAAILAGLAILLGYFLQRRRLAGPLAGLAEVAYAVPGIVLSVAFILAFIRPVLGVSIYGTLWIILAAYLAAFLAVALKPVAAAFGAMDPALDEAARVSGAGFFRRMGRIFVPLAAPAAASGAILVFLTAYNEVTVSQLLWSQGSETIGTTIFNYEDGGYTVLATAMSAVTVVATVVLMALLHVAGRRAPEGVVPWR